MKTWQEEIPRETGYQRDQSTLENENRIGLSAYDVPKAIKVSYDKPSKQFHIEFEYLTPNEPRESKTIKGTVVEDRHVRLFTGALTGKLYAAEASNVITLEEGFEDIESALVRTQAEYSNNGPRYVVPRLNLSFVRDFLEELRTRPEILQMEAG